MQEKELTQVRTDLAVEAREMYVEEEKTEKEIAGVKFTKKDREGTVVSYVEITDEGAREIGKKRGSYTTIYADSVKAQDTKKQNIQARILAEEVKKLYEKNNISSDAVCLVVGLGNWNVTPDALGPMTTEKILITNHLFKLEDEHVAAGYRPVSAITPGVMGITGMETSDIIYGIVEKAKPDFVIAIDALASRSIERVNETIQLSDSGIHPGSGVGNKRKEISYETLGIPVIAIGVPTVVDAVTIASDSIDLLLKHLGKEWREKDSPSKSLAPIGFSFGKKKLKEDDLPSEDGRKAILGMVGALSDDDKRQLLTEVLTSTGYNFMVTPKEVDGFMLDMAHLLAAGINQALHPNVNDAYFTR